MPPLRGLVFSVAYNRTYLRAIERAERNVSIDNIARIARGLGVEPWMLLRDS
jgi:transcriptional regulator with XRE-family HTH domain